MAQEFSRLSRIEQMLARKLAVLLYQEVADPRIVAMTVTKVTVSKDLHYAKVYYTPGFGNELSMKERKELEQALRSAGPFMRKRLAESCQLRFTPQLSFVHDDSELHRQKMLHLIEKAVSSVKT